MTLTGPFIISSRLMAGLKIADAVLSLGYGKIVAGRMEYEVWLDIGTKQHRIKGCRSGVGGETIQAGFESVLAFLSAAAESYSSRMRTGQKGENEDLFNAKIVEWAYQNADEISMLASDIEENKYIEE